MRTAFKKNISIVVLVWTILLSMIYSGGGAVHFLTNQVVGGIHFAVAIAWAVLAVVSAFTYAKFAKLEITEKI